MTRDEPEFCDLCDVRMELHPFPDDEDAPGCEAAEAKVRVLEIFGRWA